jgi:hypothetical protein
MVSRRDAKYVDAITKLIDREIEWLDGQDAIQSADPADDKPARGRRGESKSPARRSGRGEKRAQEEKPTETATVEAVSEPKKEEEVIQTAIKEEPRQQRAERAPAPQRAPQPANANEDRNRNRNRRGGRDNDDREPTPVGFGDEIPAFMMIGSKF